MTSLITAPPSILGGAVPHPGMAPTAISSLLVNGQTGWKEDVGDALTDISITFNIDGTSHITAQVEDPHRTLLRSKLTAQRSVMAIDGIGFVLADIAKSGSQISLTFEHVVCSKLKNHTETLSVRVNSMTRTDFVKKLCAYEGWIQVVEPGGGSIGNSLDLMSVGTVDAASGGALPLPYSTTFQERETFWDATSKVLSTIGWRRFPRGNNQLIVASDQYLYNQAPIAILDEDSQGVDTIDFDYDIRKPLGSVTITCRAEAWAFPVGSVIQFTQNMGIIGIQSSVQPRATIPGQLAPIFGHWLVTNIARSLLSATCTVTLDIPLLQLTEPQTQPPTSATMLVAGGLGQNTYTPVLSLPGTAQSGKSATSKISQFVNFAQSKVGGRYIWGGTGPVGYDCSGLVVAAAATIGVPLIHNTVSMYTQCQQAKTTCTPQTAIATYGALLFIYEGQNPGAGHMAISLGNGKTVEAADTAIGIVYGTAPPGRFNQGALLPGIAY